MKKAFIVTVKGKGNQFFYRFFENGFIESYFHNTSYDPGDEAQNVIKKYFPFHISQMDVFRHSKGVTVKEVTPDLSFKKFWDAYGHKQGKKARAERLWKQLSLAEKAKAMAYIRTYDNFLYMNKGIAKAYPETYLSQKRWENED